MEGSLQIVLLIVLMTTVAMIDGNDRSESGDDTYEYTGDVSEDCLNVNDYRNISSNNTMNIIGGIKALFTDDVNSVLIELPTKEDLENTNNLINATEENIRILNNSLINENKNIIEKVKEHLDLYNIPISDELSVIRNQTIANFYSLNKTLPSLVSKSATDKIMTEINKLATIDNIKSLNQNLTSELIQVSSEMKLLKCQNNNELLLKILNDTSLMKDQLSSINDIKISSLPPAGDSSEQTDQVLHTNEHICNTTEDILKLSMFLKTTKIELTSNLTDKSSEIMESIKEIMTLLKAQKNDKTPNNSGQISTKPSKHTFHTTDIVVILSAVTLVFLLVLVCFVMKRMGNIQSKLQHLQMQVAHERYYKRNSSVTGLQLPKYEEQKNGNVKANPKINMYEDTELTENLMTKDDP